MPEEKPKPPSEILRALSFLSQIALTIVICVFAGVMLGRTLDNWLNTSPWLLLIFSFLGMGAAFRAIFHISKKS